MKGKRGNLVLEELTELIPTIIIVIGLVSMGVLLYQAFASGNDCDNQKEWESVKKSVSLIESGARTSISTPFVNSKCALVSYSADQFNTVQPGSGSLVDGNAKVCLCKIEKEKCKPFNCYTLAKLKAVRLPLGGQVSTVGMKRYVFLDINREGSELVIAVEGETETKQSYVFNDQSENKQKVDPANFMKRLNVFYTVPGTLELTRLNVDSHPSAYPQGAVQIKDTFPFTVNLDFNLKTDTGGRKLVPKEVDQMSVEFVISPEQVGVLKENRFSANDLVLFYNKGEAWLSLKCKTEKVTMGGVGPGGSPVGEEAVCTAVIPTFIDEFFISPKEKEEPIILAEGKSVR